MSVTLYNKLGRKLEDEARLTERSTSQLSNLRTSIPQTPQSTSFSNNSIPSDKSLDESIEGTPREGNSKTVHTLEAETGYFISGQLQ